MKVREVMSSPVVTAGPDTSFHELVATLLDHGISGVPVVDSDGRVIGMVTEADLVSNQAYGYRRRRALALMSAYLLGRNPAWVAKASGLRARELMSGPHSTAHPDEELGVVARRMLENGHKRVPVIDHGRLVGIVSRHDLLSVFHRPDPAVLAEIEELLADPRRVPEDNHVTPSVSDGVVTLSGSVCHPSDAKLIEAVVARLPGVVALDNRLVALEAEPHLDRRTGLA